MREPPPLYLHRYPATSLVGLLALATTLFWWQGNDLAPLLMTFQAWRGEPWRLFPSALPHVNIFHLAFNLYWLWVFGTLVEEVFGSWRTAALMLFLAAASSAAEYAFMV